MPNSLVKSLKDVGYSPVALPSSTFGALAMPYEWHGRRGWLRATEFRNLIGGGALPEIAGPDPEVDFSGKTVTKLEANATLSILSGLIGALGGGTLGLKGGLERASTVTFTYGQVTSVDVSPTSIEQALANLTVPPASSALGRLLRDHLFVVNRVLRSREFSIQVQDSSGENIGIDVPVIQQAIGASVSVNISGSSDRTVTFKGERDVAFAFQAWWMKLDDGEVSLVPTRAGSVSTKAFAPDAAAESDDALLFDRTFPTEPEALEQMFEAAAAQGELEAQD